MRLILLISFVMVLLVPSALFAETKEIISEGTYNMGDGETPSVAESRALLKAKQTALEQAGTYVESYSKVKNITLTQDEIQVLASGLMEVEILDKKRTVVGDGINFWVKIKAKVIPDKMEEMAKRIKETSVVEDYKQIQEKYEASQKEIEKLKMELMQAKDEKQKKKVEAKIVDDEKSFQANEWFEKGKKSFDSYLKYPDKRNYYFDEAIEAYTSAIALNEKFVEAYIERGKIYSLRGQYDKAISDFSKAIVIEPSGVEAYRLRGWAFYSIREGDSAIADYNKAITMVPEDAWTYQRRGDAYIDRKRDYDKAIEDYSKVIIIYKGQYDRKKRANALNPFDGLAGSLAWAYVGLGNAYEGKGMYDKSISEFSNAILIVPELSRGYRGLGIVYSKKKQYDLSIDYLTQAISKNNWIDAWDYYYRAYAYKETGQFDKSVEDYNNALEIDPDFILAYLDRGGIFLLIGKNDKAIADFSKALSINKDDVGLNKILFNLRGHLYDITGQEDKAIEDYQKACNMGHQEACGGLQSRLKKR